MSITATEAARILSTWTDSARPPMVAVHGDWKRTHRPLTTGEIARGRRYLEREWLHRQARAEHAAREEREQLEEERFSRACADEARREGARIACSKVLAARG